MWGSVLCLLLAGAHGAWAAPLLPPDAAACAPGTLFEASSQEHSCSETLYRRKDAVEPCCRVLSEYYGPTSSRPSRNCFCLESYWVPFVALSDVHYIDWATYFQQCTGMGFPIYHFQDGEGPCAGTPDTPAPAPAPSAEAQAAAGAPGPAPDAAPAAPPAAAAEPAPILPQRTFGGWVAGLSDDGWGAASFTAAILAAMGGTMMAWSFVFDAIADLRACCSYSRRAPRSS